MDYRQYRSTVQFVERNAQLLTLIFLLEFVKHGDKQFHHLNTTHYAKTGGIQCHRIQINNGN